ncbi:hypothetical protein BU15DRAFT_58804 [Melanogaster broomeanus]|nr:hypothetical protein BU15DRAFT_58804 [Melanogaster broomeanus]
MAQEIRFNSFGIPYVVEFENVSFVPKQCSEESRTSSPDMASQNTRPIPSQSTEVSSNIIPPTCSALEHTKPLPTSPLRRNVSDMNADGLYIQFASPQSLPQMHRKDKLVIEAGMDTPPRNTDHQEPSNAQAASQKDREYRTPDALYCGTYGQMMAALEGAGLSATPCPETGYSGCTRLGALFVARPNGANGVQLRKITLWG